MDYRNIFDYSGGKVINTETLVLIIVLAVWELTWKGFALWKAATNKQSGWFVALLCLNTIGILPILYIYFFSPKSPKN